MAPELTVRVIDEPEAHLHPAAQRRVAQTLGSWSNAGPRNVVIASHSHYFLGNRAFQAVQVVPTGIVPLTSGALSVTDELAQEMGLTRGELLVTRQGILIVEGPHDRVVLEQLFSDQLNDAGVGILALYGTKNTLALLDTDFWQHFTDVPIAVMFDKTADHTLPWAQLTDEAKQLKKLLDAARKSGRHIAQIPLAGADIIVYLDEQLVHNRFAGFRGWKWVEAEWARERGAGRLKFKKFVTDRAHADLDNTDRIRSIASEMRTSRAPIHSDLRRAVEQVCAWADAQNPPSVEDFTGER